MTKELEKFNKQLKEVVNITITDEMPEEILEMRLVDLLCKHIFNGSNKALKLLQASVHAGYDYCLWNVANGHLKDFDYDMQRILKMEKENYNHALRIVVCKYSFSDDTYYWCDNIHSAIKYIRQYGDNVKLKDLPFYVVTVGVCNKSYTIADFVKDNPEFISYHIDYNGTANLAITKDKYIFWDIDGVLAPYRFNNHISDPDGTNNGMSVNEINSGCFLNRKPLKHMQNVIACCGAKQNIIMGHCLIQKEMDDKQILLDKYYPNITERLLVFEDIPKYQVIIKYCKNHNIALNDVVFVDDTLNILREAERHGIPSWRISSFMDWSL